MSAENIQADRYFFARWIRATFAGYILGFVLVIVGAIAGDLIGMAEGQAIVGIAMGAGIGYGQARMARQWLGDMRRWVLASMVGMGVPFVVFDIAATIWTELPRVTSIQLDVMIGGLLVGLLQRSLLPSSTKLANWWVLASTAAWTLAAVTASITFHGEWDALLNLTMILSGGVVLGAVTGGALVWMLRSDQDTSPQE